MPKLDQEHPVGGASQELLPKMDPKMLPSSTASWMSWPRTFSMAGPPSTSSKRRPEPAFFGFLAGNLDVEQEVLFAQSFVGFDVIGPHGSGRAYELS